MIFEDRPARGLLALLRRGFRHCFCLLRGESGWLLCDPQADRLELRALPPLSAVALARAYARLGGTVVALAATPPGRRTARLRLAPLTCVEVVKRAIGYERRGVVTPFGLFRALSARSEVVFLAEPDRQGR